MVSEKKKNDLCPRLIDFLIIVGSHHPGRLTGATNSGSPGAQKNSGLDGLNQDDSGISNNDSLGFASTSDSLNTVNTSSPVNPSVNLVQHPELLRRYPSENHKDFELPYDVTVFCQPEGCTTLGAKKITLRETSSFVFTLTEKDSNKVRYGISLNFYRRHEIKKSYSTLVNQNTPEGKQTSRRRQKCFTLTSLCIISHHPFFSTFRQVLAVLRKLIDACNERTSSKKIGGSKLGRDAVWNVLAGQWPKDQNIPPVVMHEIKELECWILRLLSAPVPVPGKTKVELELLPCDLFEPLCFALPESSRFSLVDYPLHLPLELLGVESVIKVLTCIMLEFKVVLQSRDFNAVSMCVMSLVKLLYPLEYMFPVIPLLPTCMYGSEQLLLAPTPYLIGVPASFFSSRRLCKLPNDVTLVDLDSNKVILPENMEFPRIPEPDYVRLQTHFRQALVSMNAGLGHEDDTQATPPVQATTPVGSTYSNSSSRDASSTRDTQESSPRPNHHDPNTVPIIQTNQRIGLIFNNDIDSVDVATRVAMVRFFNSPNILGRFVDHTRVVRLYPRPLVTLRVDSFIRSRPLKTKFVFELAKTQAVEFFAEWALTAKNQVFMKVQNGTFDPAIVGDKQKWYSDSLQAISFCVNLETSTLPAAYKSMVMENAEKELTDESAGSGSDGQLSSSSSMSSVTDLMFQSPDKDFDPLSDFGAIAAEPISSEITDVYRAPVALELPELSRPNSTQSSAPSSPCSLAPGADSEGDFAKLAENLAIRTDAEGHTIFDSSTGSQCIQSPTSEESSPAPSPEPTPQAGRKIIPPSPIMGTKLNHSQDSSSSTPTAKTPTQKFTFKGFNLGEPSDIMNTISDQLGGYAGKTHSLLNKFVDQIDQHATPPAGAAGQPREKTTTPFPTSNDRRPQGTGVPPGTQRISSPSQALAPRPPINPQQSRENAEKAIQYQKNQQTVKEYCDGAIAGSGVSFISFILPKMRKLMEDEGLRRLACSKLNHNLLKPPSAEAQFLEHMVVSKSVWKGMIRIMQACMHGLEFAFQNPAGPLGGLASGFHFLEILYIHHWSKEHELQSQFHNASHNSGISSYAASLQNTPSSSMQDLSHSHLKANENQPFYRNDIRGSVRSDTGVGSESLVDQSIGMRQTSFHEGVAIQKNRPRGPPARPPPPKQNSIAENSRLRSQKSIQSIDIPDESHLPTVSVCDVFVEDETNSGSDSKSESGVDSKKSQAPRQYISKSVGPSPNAPKRLSLEKTIPTIQTQTTPSPDMAKHYLYQELFNGQQSGIWTKVLMWETMFFDAVALERELVGMDQEPQQLMDRYFGLADADRKRLEQDEDAILTTLLYNMTSFMIMVNIPRPAVQQHIRRLMSKCHIGLIYSQVIHDLLAKIPQMTIADMKLKPLGSRLIHKQSFTVHKGSDASGDIVFLEVCDDAIVFRGISGAIVDRWWYEQLVNMTFSPKTKVLCLWRKSNEKLILHKFYLKKCRDLYNCVKNAMERAASRGKVPAPGRQLGGEFSVQDVETNETGMLQVRIDGVSLVFGENSWFIELGNIKKCNSYKSNVFVLEELDRKRNQLIQRKYTSPLARQIALALHRVMSVVFHSKQMFTPLLHFDSRPKFRSASTERSQWTLVVPKLAV